MQPKHVGENPQVMLKQIMSTARVLLKSCLNHALNSHHFPMNRTGFVGDFFI